MTRVDYERVVGKPSKATAKHITHRFEYIHVLSDEELKAQVEGLKKFQPSWAEDPEELREWVRGYFLRR